MEVSRLRPPRGGRLACVILLFLPDTSSFVVRENEEPRGGGSDRRTTNTREERKVNRDARIMNRHHPHWPQSPSPAAVAAAWPDSLRSPRPTASMTASRKPGAPAPSRDLERDRALVTSVRDALMEATEKMTAKMRAANVSDDGDRVELLEQDVRSLARGVESGLIGEEDFAMQKSRILGQI